MRREDLSNGLRRDELRLLDEIPFAEVYAKVPINAADPVAAARAFATREVGLAETAAARTTPPDWRREENPQAPLDSHHHVTLHTPWQSHLA